MTLFCNTLTDADKYTLCLFHHYLRALLFSGSYALSYGSWRDSTPPPPWSQNVPAYLFTLHWCPCPSRWCILMHVFVEYLPYILWLQTFIPPISLCALTFTLMFCNVCVKCHWIFFNPIYQWLFMAATGSPCLSFLLVSLRSPKAHLPKSYRMFLFFGST